MTVAGEPWFLEREAFDFMLGSGREPTQEQYRAAASAVLEVFPMDWAELEMEEQRKAHPESVGAMSLRPYLNHRLIDHPVPFLLTHAPMGRDAVAEIYRLGRDLTLTRDINGIGELRRDLRVFTQYPGRLFELELFATLRRSGVTNLQIRADTPDVIGDLSSSSLWIEAKHRGPELGRVAASAIQPPMVEFSGEFFVTIYRGTDPYRLAREVSEALAQEYNRSAGAAFNYPGRNFSVRFVPGSTRKMEVSFESSGEDWRAEILAMVSSVLDDKASKLRRAIKGHARAKAIIAIDCRSFIPTTQRHRQQFYVERAERDGAIRQSVLDLGGDFLLNNPEMTALLFWLGNDEDPGDRINRDLRASSVVPLVAVASRQGPTEVARDELELARLITGAV